MWLIHHHFSDGSVVTNIDFERTIEEFATPFRLQPSPSPPSPPPFLLPPPDKNYFVPISAKNSSLLHSKNATSPTSIIPMERSLILHAEPRVYIPPAMEKPMGYVHETNNPSPEFRPLGDMLILKHVQVHGFAWDKLVESFCNSHSKDELKKRYLKLIQDLSYNDPLNEHVLMHNNLIAEKKFARAGRPWRPDEDDKIFRGVKRFKTNWKIIREEYDLDRSAHALRNRAGRLGLLPSQQKPPDQPKTDPSIV